MADKNNDIVLDDEYVAGLLAKDAQNFALRYSALGMDALTEPSKKPGHLPKPNTRFLRNIIKSTNSHNAALLAKEATESHSRLREIEREEERRQRRASGSHEIRRRQMGDINAILGGSSKPTKERRDRLPRSPGSAENHQSRHAHTNDPAYRQRPNREDGRRRRHSPASDAGDRHSRKRRRRDSESPEPQRHSRSRSPERRESRRESRRHDHSPRGHREKRDRHEDRKLGDGERVSRRKGVSQPQDHATSVCDMIQDRLRSHQRSSARHDARRVERSTRSRSQHSPQGGDRARSEPQPPSEENSQDDDSDPLDAFIGPAPPPAVAPTQVRGRGAISRLSGIDQRFSETYDPKMDIHPDSDDDGGKDAKNGDWDDAVEAFRDRQKLRVHQAERMRAAGFSETTVSRLSHKGSKTDEQDVGAGLRWAGAGEPRQWDLDKTEIDN